MFGDNQAFASEVCDDGLLYTGGDMFYMWFGTVLMVLVFEVRDLYIFGIEGRGGAVFVSPSSRTHA